MDIRALVEKALERDLSDASALTDLFEAVRLLEAEDFQEAHQRGKEIRRLSAKYAVEQGDTRMFELNKRAMLFDAPYDFDAYCQYIEWDRATDKRFYIPRRKQLYQVARALQRLADGELELLAVSLPPGVGKTTLALFFLTWLGGRNPDKPILGGSHSNAFLRGAYDELLSSLATAIAVAFNAVVSTLGALVRNLEWEEVGTAVGNAINDLFSKFDFESLFSGLENLARGLINGLSIAIKTVEWEKVGRDIIAGLKKVDWKGLLSDLGTLIGDAFVVFCV